MKNKLATLMMMVLGIAATASAAPLKVPADCHAAKDAKASHQGYADRIIHQKTGLELILIHPGKFIMGASPFRSANSAHPVTITQPFYMGKTEVTNAQFRKFVKESKYNGKPDVDPDPDYDLYLRHWRGKSIMSKEDNYPVVWVSWKNAKAFCKWSGLKLPSETQWEYACRAGTTTLYSFGNDPKQYPKYGWSHEARTPENHFTHPVATKLPNPWGLHDMHGNVWEWVEDDWQESFNGAPSNESARVVQGAMTKIIRGGSWGNSPAAHHSSSSARYNSAPTNAGPEFGFRVILQLNDVVK